MILRLEASPLSTMRRLLPATGVGGSVVVVVDVVV
jgi:hypothetical protein